MKKPHNTIANAPLATSIADVAPASLKTRGGLSFLHIDAAISLANLCMELGKKYDKDTSAKPTDAQKTAYKACVIGTLFTAVAFLEAAINEVFLDAVESIPEKDRKEQDASISVKDGDITCSGVVESQSRENVKRMAQIWLRQRRIKKCAHFSHLVKFLDRQNDFDKKIESWSVLDKYQAALFLNKKSPFGKGLKRQAAYTLIDLRNYLTHSKPEWVALAGPEGIRLGPEKERSANIERGVKLLIESDPLRPAAGYLHERVFLASPFPQNCLSSALAKIAVKSAVELDSLFCNWMGMKNVISKYPQLQQQISGMHL